MLIIQITIYEMQPLKHYVTYLSFGCHQVFKVTELHVLSIASLYLFHVIISHSMHHLFVGFSPKISQRSKLKLSDHELDI